MGIIRADAGKTVKIAYQGENKRQQVAFPLADIMEEFPGGTAVLAILRKGDTDPVPAAITEMDGTDLIWTVTAWECAKDDFIYAQITYAVDEVVAKTKTYRFDVKGSLIVSAAEPETWQDMVGQMVTAAAALQAAIDAYDAMTAEATGLAAGSTPTAEIDHTGDHPVLQLGIPAGANGYSPNASVSKVGKKATITITDQHGTTTAEISDGSDGADVIDDTAGSGDTGKTWSADKIVGELGDKYEKPAGGIPATDLAGGVQTSLGKADTAYQKPNGGVPATDMASSVQTSLGKADTAYQKPSGGVPATDMASSVQTSLGKADTAYQKPSGGIPATDLASGVIPDPTSIIDDAAGDGDTGKVWSADKLHDELSLVNGAIQGKQDAPETAGTAGQVLSLDNNLDPVWTTPQSGGGSVTDVQVNGTSVVTSGVANVPLATNSVPGVAKINSNYGIQISNGSLLINRADGNTVKAGTESFKPLAPANTDWTVFYGLARAAGDTTQKNSSNAVGTYTPEAKSAIHEMLNGAVSVSGSTPSITAKAGVRYICGEVSTLTIVVPSTGIIDVTFESGSTATVLTVTPPTGVTMSWANGFDPTSLEANKTYEINIMDGHLGVGASWT